MGLNPRFEYSIHPLDIKLKEVELEKERESLRAIQIQKARDILAILRDYRDEMDEIMIPLIVQDQEQLLSRIAEGKLISAKKIDDISKRLIEHVHDPV